MDGRWEAGLDWNPSLKAKVGQQIWSDGHWQEVLEASSSTGYKLANGWTVFDEGVTNWEVKSEGEWQ